ncbi:glucose 1-dehydrogenase [Paenibacillus alkaliterrae]|uniref:SDR family NAD(P)-dependent oxidoreductase n=1 Tax=Paenibacillus alkaliterrae TaxID=320909 RepID=UPI001F300DC4|nr:glucose 1-dehydrogenase [Paenibacillus alkaliterrae]MCF2939625.1 glucose 1-dehydrogenase [Paenibacillus alkaliterrae]
MLSAHDVLNLTGKVAVITGGASGIGLATAELLASFGALTVLLDINEAQGIQAVTGIKEKGGRAGFYRCDVSSSADCERVASEIAGSYGRIDILFNNAGVIRRKTVVELEERDWDLVLDVSLKGVYLLSKYVIPIMERNGGGSIINSGSGWGLKGGDRAAAYCAAKAGVVNLTRAMAIDHGVANIRVNCVSPGDTDTPLLRDEAKQLKQDEAAFLVASAGGRPLERLGTPRDIANAVLFLASDLSSWVTGSVLVVDGGGIA